MKYRHFQEILSNSDGIIELLDLPDPTFDFTVGMGSDHASLLVKDFDEVGDPDIVLREAFESGRVLLHGEGGVGKSTIARRLVADMLLSGEPALMINLSEWGAELAAAWEGEELSGPGRAELLFRSLSPIASLSELLSSLGPGVRCLIAFDGLNEAPGGRPDEILKLVDEIAARFPQVGLLVTDRLLRRELPSRQWKLGLVIDVQAPDGFLSSGQPLIERNAFFISLAGSQPDSDSSSATAILDRYFSDVVNLNDNEIADAAEAAALSYKEFGSRVFQKDGFVAASDQGVVQALEEAGAILCDDKGCMFQHHLLHDDLAARWLVAEKDRWNAETFRWLTLDSNSFDILALALDRADASDSDFLLTQFYDFNYYGAAYALAESDRLGESGVTDGTRLALLSMLAERRWDQVRPTVLQVEDALSVFPDDMAVSFRTAENLAAVISIVDEASLEGERLMAWKQLFTRTDEISDGEIATCLDSDDPLIGWTSANVFRRTLADPLALETVVRLLVDSPSKVSRWRAAHALGGQRQASILPPLLGAVDEDPDSWVRYGAIRSLVDIAAGAADLRESILDSLESLSPRISEEKVLVELWRSLQRVDPPPGWFDAVTPLVESLWRRSDSRTWRDRWMALGSLLID